MIRSFTGSAIILILSCSGKQQDAYVVQSANASQTITDSTTLSFPWLNNYALENTLINRISVPEGFKRPEHPRNSFAFWLNHLPLKKGQPEVYLYNGNKKRNQEAQAAVLDIDVGNRDLQQCADAVMRLRAEYLYSSGQQDRISFNFTSGDACSWKRWRKGERIVVKGNTVSWKSGAKAQSDYAEFRNYLNMVFSYAGTLSLARELHSKSIADIRVGDVFIQGGSPGHAVLVMDLAKNDTGKTLVLLAQSYMPAQDIHLLRNNNNAALSPWYEVDPATKEIRTPEWTFNSGDLKSFE